MKDKRFLQVGLILLAAIVITGLTILLSEESAIYAGPGENTPTIGYVNIQLIFQQHPEKFKAEQLLHERASEIQAKLETEAKDLEGEEKQALLEKYQLELMEFEQDLIQDVVAQMDAEIRQIAEEAGVVVVMESQNVIYGGLDLTKPVLERIREAAQNDG